MTLVIDKCRLSPAGSAVQLRPLPYAERRVARLIQEWQNIVRTYKQHETIQDWRVNPSDLDKLLFV